MSFFFDHDDDWSAVALESFACLCVLYAHLLCTYGVLDVGVMMRILDVSDQNEELRTNYCIGIHLCMNTGAE